MKKSIIAFFFFTLCLTSKAQLDTASFDASFFVNLNSQQINLTSSNTATVSFSIQFYDTTYWDYKVALEHQVYEYDRSWQNVLNKVSTDWWQGGNSSTPTSGFYYPGDSITLSLSFNYNPNYLPYSYRALRIEVQNNANELIGLEKPMVYFTPYNTLEVWNYDDFLDLKRSWDSPEEGLLTASRATYIHPDLHFCEYSDYNYQKKQSLCLATQGLF